MLRVHLSARTHHRIQKVARPIANTLGIAHFVEALQYWLSEAWL